MARTRSMVGSVNPSRATRRFNLARGFGDADMMQRYRASAAVEMGMASRTPDGHINYRIHDVDDEFYDHLYRYYGGDEKRMEKWFEKENRSRTYPDADTIIKGSERIKSGLRKKAYASVTG